MFKFKKESKMKTDFSDFEALQIVNSHAKIIALMTEFDKTLPPSKLPVLLDTVNRMREVIQNMFDKHIP